MMRVPAVSRRIVTFTGINMASYYYLWKNRAKFPVGSKKFFYAWAKRAFTFRVLFRRNTMRNSLVRKGARISDTAEIDNAIITGHKNLLFVGDNSFIGRAHIALHDEVNIGSRVCINDSVEILTASHDVLDAQWRHIKAKIIIEDYVWVGTGAMLLPGVHLGKGVVVGARSVVTRSVPAGCIVAGNPAKILSKKRCEELDYDPCEFLAANRSWLIG